MEEKATSQCPICGSQAGYDSTGPYAKIHKCVNPECQHMFAFEATEIQGMVPHNPDKDFSAFEERDKNLIQYWQRDGFIDNTSRLLDIGSGYGHIILALKMAGYSKLRYRYIPELYPGISKSFSSYLSRHIFNYLRHFLGWTTHLTYFAGI